MNTFKLSVLLFKFINKKYFYLILFFSFLATLLETVGLALIVPLLDLITGDQLNIFVKNFLSFFSFDIGNLKKNTLILYIFIFLIFFYFFKFIFTFIIILIHNKIIFYFKKEISKRLYKKYLYFELSHFSKIHTSSLVRNITKEIDNCMGVLISTISFILESMMVIGVTMVIIFYTPASIIPISFVFLVGWIYLHFTNKKVKIWGEERQVYDKKYLENIFNSLNGIKELKIFSSEKYFIKRFSSILTRLVDIMFKTSIVRALPKHIFEFLGILVISLSIIFNLYFNDNVDKVIPILGLFAAAAFRILPSANKIVADISVLRFSYPSVDLIYKEILSIKDEDENKKIINISFKEKININELSFSYNNKEILQNANISIDKGDFIGIKGESGSGKTTFANILVGLLKPTKGKITIDNQNIIMNPNLFEGWKKILAYVPQEVFLLRDTLKGNVAFGLEENKIDESKVLRCLKQSVIDPKIVSDKDSLNGIISERGISISGGQKQRIGIARSLYFDSEVIIFDESTSSLDDQTENEIIKTIKEISNFKTIIMISHRDSALKYCNKIFELKNKNFKLIYEK
tara:strand:- start:613 stop:2340 length:1728 start_codon:yes stop_codon:yes gene_type:complete